MSLLVQKNLLSLFIFVIITLIMACSTHQLSVSLIGSFISFLLAILIYIINKLNIRSIFFISFHFITITLILIFQTPEIIAIAFLAFLFREFILLAKDQAEKGSRTSLLWDLGVIKPKRQLSPVLNQTTPFIIASLISSFLANLFSLPAILLAYFPLFIFAIGFGSLIVEELTSAATE